MDRYGGASTEYLYIYLHNQSKSISAPSTKVIINFFSITFFGGADRNRTDVLIAIHTCQQYHEYLVHIVSLLPKLNVSNHLFFLQIIVVVRFLQQ